MVPCAEGLPLVKSATRASSEPRVPAAFYQSSFKPLISMLPMRRGRPPQEFRAHWLIRALALAALAVWIAAAVVAAIFELPPYTYVSILFFIVYFSAFVAHYWQMAYVVDDHGVTVRGPTDKSHFAWEDIEHVRSSSIPLGGHYVTTKTGGFVLSSFVTHRDRLLDTIIARAGLFPSYR